MKHSHVYGKKIVLILNIGLTGTTQRRSCFQYRGFQTKSSYDNRSGALDSGIIKNWPKYKNLKELDQVPVMFITQNCCGMILRITSGCFISLIITNYISRK